MPHNITRHVHPKARPETNEPTPPPATGIDYLTLTADTHHQQISRDQQIGYHALYGTTPPETATDDDGQIPGQLSIDDIDNNDNNEGNEGNEGNEVRFG